MLSGNVPVNAPDGVKELALSVRKTPALHNIAKKAAPAYGQMARYSRRAHQVLNHCDAVIRTS